VESISLSIAPGAVLRTFEESDSAELTAVIAGKRAQIEANDGFEGAIVLDGRIVGGAGFHGVDRFNCSTTPSASGTFTG
jgi:hypothetical protein